MARKPKKDEPTEDVAELDLVATPGYSIIERDGVRRLVDDKSIPELEVQGWRPAK